MSRVSSGITAAKFHLKTSWVRTKRVTFKALPHKFSDSVLHGLERDGATEQVNLRLPGWRSDRYVAGWKSTANSASLDVPATGPLTQETHVWDDIRVWELSNAVLDVSSGLVFLGDRVASASGNGFRSARDAAFISGAFRRINSIKAESVNGVIAPLGDTWHHYHFLLETLPKILAIKQLHPNVVFTGSCEPSPAAAQVLADLEIAYQLTLESKVLNCEKVLLCEASPQFLPHPEEVLRVRESLLKTYGQQTTRRNRKVYLSRRNAARSISNEQYLEEKLAAQGFDIVSMESLIFSDQVRLMQETELLVAPHGAGLVNLMFLPHGSSAIEISSGESFEMCYRRIAAALEIEYSFVELSSTPEEPYGNGRNAAERVSNVFRK